MPGKKNDTLPKISLARIGAERCRREGGLAFFCKEFWYIIVSNPLVWSKHMDVLCHEIETSDRRVFQRLEKLYDLIINVPPGTSKTKIISVLSTAWEFAMMPNIKVFVGSYSDNAVSGIAREIRRVMKSAKYREWFPEVEISKEKDSLHNFTTEANGEFYAFTVGGSLMSKHADILKVDDPIDPKGAKSEAERVSTNTFFDETLPSRKVDKAVTPTYLIMQRLNEMDPTGHLLKKKGDEIRHVKLPGVALENNVKPAAYRSIYTFIDLPEDHVLALKYKRTRLGFLDPERNGPKVLADAAKDYGTYGYAGQIDQDPSPANGLVWQREWFRIIPDEYMPRREKGEGLGTDWDLAYTKKKINAASSFITSFRYNKFIFLDDLGWAWKEFPDLIKWMKLKPAGHYIEAKASGISAKQTLSKSGIIAIEMEVKGGEDKLARARMASPTAESGMICVRATLAAMLFDSEQSILKFPNGEYADLADVLAQCVQRHTTNGMIIHSGPQYDEDRENESYQDEYGESDLLDELKF